MNEFQLPSEEQFEKFLRGESDLEFRSLTDINFDGARYVKREVGDKEVEYLVIKGIATTAAIDDNGVEVTPDALKSLPADFQRRNTLLFNHNPDFPIGSIGKAKYVNGANGRKRSRPARVDVDPVLVDTEVRLPTGQRVVDAIDRRTLTKFSFAWSTRDGIIVFPSREAVDEEEIKALGFDPEGAHAFRIGRNNAPQIRVNSLVGVELSIVSVPADAAAEFGSRFKRNLSQALERHVDGRNGIFVPESYQEDSEGRILVPIDGFRAVEPAEVKETVEEEVDVPDRIVDVDLSEEPDHILKFRVEIDEVAITADIVDAIKERVQSELAKDAAEAAAETVQEEIVVEEEVVESSKNSVPYEAALFVIDRPWVPENALERVIDWAKGEEDSELDLENEDHRGRFSKAFVCWDNEGREVSDYFMLHHDVVDGDLVSNLRALDEVYRELDEIDFGDNSGERIDLAVSHLISEYQSHDEEIPADLISGEDSIRKEGG